MTVLLVYVNLTRPTKMGIILHQLSLKRKKYISISKGNVLPNQYPAEKINIITSHTKF